MMSSQLLTIGVALVISITLIVVLTRYLKIHAFFALLVAAVVCGVITGLNTKTLITSLQDGFGGLMGQIGFVVALGSCLGIMLEKTGGMLVISERIVHWFGKKRSALALSFTGLLVGIPVFCDSGFIILSRLIPGISQRSGLNPVYLGLALSTGLYTTHTLVPPTPGPLAAANTLGLSNHIPLVVLLGIVAAIPVGLVAFFLAGRLSRNVVIQEDSGHVDSSSGDMPKAWKAFLPLLFPIIAIASGSLPKLTTLPPGVDGFLEVIGNPIVALTIVVLLSFTLLKRKQREEWPGWIQEALKDAGIILLITGAGGAFGAVIKQSGVGDVLKAELGGSSMQGVILLLVGYALAAVLKTAQGSTTTAMMVTSALMVPLLPLDASWTVYQLAALTMAIGGGAMTVSHANDSYFWVVSQFGRISTKDALRTFTVITFFQGLTALVVSILIFILF